MAIEPQCFMLPITGVIGGSVKSGKMTGEKKLYLSNEEGMGSLKSLREVIVKIKRIQSTILFTIKNVELSI